MIKRYARGIVRDWDRFLVVFNKKRLRYEFPGGKCDEGETYRTSIYRELKEEIGIDAIELELFRELNLTIHGTWKGEEDEGFSDWHGQFFLVTKWIGIPHIPESEAHKLGDLRWVTTKELVKLPQIPLVTVELARDAFAQALNYDGP